jgi:hypothetical protein
MKRHDIVFILVVLAIFAPFFICNSLYDVYCKFNLEHGLVMSFLKFAILATLGESLGLRIRKGIYDYKGFGLLPRAIVWGFLGIAIKVSFLLFQPGAANLLGYLGIAVDDSFGIKFLQAFSASTLLNLIFAPVMMSIHKITDTHIIETGGTVNGLFSKIDVAAILQRVDWRTMWGFVFKKTIPLFWIPAHTITFLLPVGFQVLFAAVLGVVLGVILAFAANKAK